MAYNPPQVEYSLEGKLTLSSSGWLLLSVPNALGRGCFSALNEIGVELPDAKEYNAHISVMRPEEIEEFGGIHNFSERGKTFSYTLGPVKSVNPAGWDEVERVWFVTVRSPELEKLRKSYGLSALPKEGTQPFHITFAVRYKNVLASDTNVAKRITYGGIAQLIKRKS